ncbi:MAG: tetratricopeptide repeat protein [Chloroherpetonaceae bacterium]|nr:tetratricopeptide repeat protein [Chloroherpetonaceae bacterium]MDW8020867.1 tetratricopeptide repeat protein [Chloroherpetonaceae bacterium]
MKAPKRAEYPNRSVSKVKETASQEIDTELEQIFIELHQSPRETLARIRRLQELVHKHSNPEVQSRALLAEGIAEVLLSNYARGKEYLSSAIAQLSKLGDQKGVALAHRFTGAAYFKTGDYQKAQKAFQRAKKIYEQINDLRGVGVTLNNLAALDQRFGNFKDALSKFLESAEILRRCGDEANEGATLANAALLLERLGDYRTALEYALKALTCIEKHHNPMHTAAVFTTLASLSMKLGNLTAAMDYALKSKQSFEASGEKFGIATALTLLAELYQQQRKFPDALAMYRQALSLRQALQDRWGMADVWMRIGQLFADEKKWQEAENAYEESLSLFEQGGEKARLAQVKLALSKVWLQKQLFKKAEKMLQDALTLAEEAGSTEEIAAIHNALALLYANTGRYKQAYEHHCKFAQIDATLKDAERLKQMQYLQIRFDVERLRDERKFFEHKAEKLEGEMKRKQKELMRLTMSLVRKNEFLKSLYDMLGDVQLGASKKTQNAVQKIRAEIQASLRSEETWRLFEAQFSELHKTFLQTLAERYPNLTPTEIKVAAMLRLDLSTKEIAALLYASERTVETHRQNLRRKLRLGAEISLQTFLASL